MLTISAATASSRDSIWIRAILRSLLKHTIDRLIKEHNAKLKQTFYLQN